MNEPDTREATPLPPPCLLSLVFNDLDARCDLSTVYVDTVMKSNALINAMR